MHFFCRGIGRGERNLKDFLKIRHILGVLCLGTNEGGDADDCEMRKGKFPIWELDLNTPIRIKGTFCPLDPNAVRKVGKLPIWQLTRCAVKCQLGTFRQNGYGWSEFDR